MKLRTPVNAIREKCLDCCCYQYAEVKLCEATRCPLWPYRLGKRPTEEDRVIVEAIPQEEAERHKRR